MYNPLKLKGIQMKDILIYHNRKSMQHKKDKKQENKLNKNNKLVKNRRRSIRSTIMISYMYLLERKNHYTHEIIIINQIRLFLIFII